MFRKPKKNVRSRGPIEIEDEQEEDKEEEIVVIQDSINKLKEKKKDKKKKKNKDKDKEKDKEKKSTLLSFEEEGDAEEFQIKKSSASRKLMKMKGKERLRSPEKEEPEPKPEKNGKQRQGGAGMKIMDDDVDIQVNKDQTWTVSGREAEALHAEEEDVGEDVDSDSEDPIQKIIQSGGIPDAAAIHAARKRREAIRAKGGKDDYVPLKPKKKKAGDDDKKDGPRLVREEDEEEVDDEERISFTVGNNKEEYHRRVGKEEEGSSDEGEGSWETMQIRKAIKGNQVPGSMNDEVSIVGEGWAAAPSNVTANGPKQLPKPANYDLKGIRDRMKQRCSDLKDVSTRHERDTDKAVDDLVTSQSEITRLEAEIPKLAIRHRMFQQLRGYMTDLVDCYDEKVGTIGYMENRLNKMYEEHRGKLRERRRQDVRDQCDVLAGMVAGANVVFDPVQDAMRDFRVAEREGRQRRRRKARITNNIARHNEGLSSDDEMPGQDLAALATVKKDVENQARICMEDVIEDFADLSVVQDKMVGWREDDVESYKSAYVSLCLPKVFSPLIRMQMLFWNPFTSTSEIQEMDWYATLSLYALYAEEDIGSLVTDPDRNLISSCVEKVVVPKIAEIIRTGYDPMSTGQTNRLIGVLTRLITDFPTLSMRSKHLRLAFSSVTDIIKDALDQDVYIPMYSRALLEATSTPHFAFFHRQFYTALKLLKNILAWQCILSENMILELAVDSLLNRYLLLSLRTNPDVVDAIDKARVIIDCLPDAWISSSASLRGKLGMFIKFLGTAGSSAELPRDAVQEAARLTKKLGDHETSNKLKTFLQ